MVITLCIYDAILIVIKYLLAFSCVANITISVINFASSGDRDIYRAWLFSLCGWFIAYIFILISMLGGK